MRAFFDLRQRLHAPVSELHNGAFVAYAETPARADAILAAIGPTEAPADQGEGPILAVHDRDYLAFLKDAPALWRAAGRSGDAIPYVWPVVRRRTLELQRIDALLGRYTFDATTPITDNAWTSSYWSAQSALAAVDAIGSGASSAFALCRPPGHHAGADYAGGYCHLNAAAIAAQAARAGGAARVAILDIDYHHGNGTQDIFWTRGDVFYASIHADPASDYPFYWGHADEVGEDAGQGVTLNLPLPHGTRIDAFMAAVDKALAAITVFAPEMLILSFGADTWKGDPISRFALRTEDYTVLAQRIAARPWPTAILMEGGYAVDALGRNVSAFLNGW